MSSYDLSIGDIVQIRSGAKFNAGLIGRIIGTRLSTDSKGNDILLYTVQFSDTKSDEFVALYLQPVRSIKPQRDEKPYQTRRKK